MIVRQRLRQQAAERADAHPGAKILNRVQRGLVDQTNHQQRAAKDHKQNRGNAEKDPDGAQDRPLPAIPRGPAFLAFEGRAWNHGPAETACTIVHGRMNAQKHRNIPVNPRRTNTDFCKKLRVGRF